MDELTWIAWGAAFWTAVIGFAAWQERVRFAGRFLVGLTAGAALAHFGWAALHLPVVLEQPRALFQPTLGYSVLFVPLGLFLAAPWRARRDHRDTWFVAAFGALPLGFAVARLGCLAGDCCHGVLADVPWAIGEPPRHPTALYDIVGLVGLHLVIRGLPRGSVPSAVLIGFGAIRILVQPWRAAPPLGDPLVHPFVLAAAWIAIGALISPAGQRMVGRLKTAFFRRPSPSRTQSSASLGPQHLARFE
jgi:hypothetical protein